MAAAAYAVGGGMGQLGMTGRADEIATFLAAAGWTRAQQTPLTTDASARRYLRLSLNGRSAILMDAPAADPSDETGRFLRVGAWLRSHGYSAPEVYREDAAAGLLLLEDLGDDLFARLLSAGGADEKMLYACTIDFLLDLGRHDPPGFVTLNDGLGLVQLLNLTEAWLLPSVGCGTPHGLGGVKAAFVALYDELNALPPVLSLRDFHAENLLWLPDRQGVARCGLLDFQDAIATHPAYDVVSLLQDARRDVSVETEAQMVARYLAGGHTDPDQFCAIYALIGAQRALRILGVFARLARSLGKPRYLDFVPRVWSNLQRNVGHPALRPLADALREVVPVLGDDELAMMRTAWIIPDR